MGDIANTAIEHTMTGDATLSNTGVIDLTNNAVETAEINDNAVDGYKIEISGNSNGSLMYYDGTNWVNIAPGSAGQVLQSNGAAAPTWVNPSSLGVTNTLTNATNTITSTVNGVVATAPAVNTVSNTSSTNTLSTTVNGVTGSTVPIINTNALTVSSGALTSTVNGVSSSPAIDLNASLIKKDIVPNTSSVVTITNGTSQVVGATNVTLDVQGTSGGVLYGKGTGTAAAFTSTGTSAQVLHGNGTGTPAFGAVVLTTDVSGVLPIANGGTNSTATPTAGGVGYGTGTAHAYNSAGTTGQILESGVAGAPTWINKTSILNTQNGLTTVTTGGSASATVPYAELGGTLYKNTVVNNAGFNLTFDATTGVSRFNHTSTTAATTTSYPFGINRAGSTELTLGSDASFAYLQSWNSKPLLLNGQGNSIGINLTTAPGASLEIGGTPNNAFRTAYLNISANNASVTDRPYIRGLANHLVICPGTTAGASTMYYSYPGDLVAGNTVTTRIQESLIISATGSGGAGTVTINNLAGTGNRPVFADASGTLKTTTNSIWAMSSNIASSQDDLGGTVLSADGADDNTYDVAMPFSVIIEGVTYTNLAVCTNGWASFETSAGQVTTTALGETALPSSTFNNPTVLAYWDDLKDYGAGEALRSQTFGTSPNRTLVIDWKMRAFNATVYNVFFQMEIHEGSNMINVKYHGMDAAYCGQSATIGFQLAGGASAKAYALTYDGKILDDNAAKSEGWSICPVR